MDLYLMADGETTNLTNASAADRARGEALRWFDELRDPLWRYLMCIGASPADADEAVQEGFLRLYRHLKNGGGLSNLRGWLFQVTRNYVRDQRKSARRQRSVPLDDAIERDRFVDPHASPEHCMLGEERTLRLRAAIEKLPQPERECMLLRASGLRYREIAAVWGINVSGAGALVRRAMARLSEDLS